MPVGSTMEKVRASYAKAAALAAWEGNGYDPAKVGPELDKLITTQIEPLHDQVAGAVVGTTVGRKVVNGAKKIFKGW
jgi:hypothetical protein